MKRPASYVYSNEEDEAMNDDILKKKGRELCMLGIGISSNLSAMNLVFFILCPQRIPGGHIKIPPSICPSVRVFFVLAITLYCMNGFP